MIFTNAKLYTMEEKTGTIEKGYLETEGDKIISLGDMEVCPDLKDKEVYDLNGLSLFPGFVDSHCHLGMWEDYIGEEGEDGNEMTDPINPHLRGIDALNPVDKTFREALEAGVTSVVTGPGSASVMSGQMVAIKTYGNRVDDMVIDSTLAFKFALGENPKKVYGKQHKAPSTRMSSAALMREALEKAKRYQEGLKLSKNDPSKKPVFDIKSEALLPLLKKEKKAHIHAHRLDDIFTAIRICKEFDIDFILVHCTEGYMMAEELKKENVNAISGPFLTDRSKPELKNMTAKAPGILSKAGIPTAICTDSPVIPLNYLPLCAGIAVKEGMDYEQALRAITIEPAKIVGIDKRVGSLKVGKDADLVVFAGDPLSVYAKPKVVVCNGDWVYTNITK